MGGRSDDDARASTLAAPATAPSERTSRPELSTHKAGDPVGRYELVARLGAGAMGVVWSAHDPQLDRKVAIKLVHPSLARSPEASSRLLREARAMAKLSHRAVVTVHDAGDVDGQLFLAMELVEGTNLGTMLRARNADAVGDWERWLDLMIDAGHGLAAAHRSGVLHRDFKPDNVLVDESGRVCVGDFGLATLGEDQFAAALTSRWQHDRPYDLTTTGALLGTPAYMGPQQLRGEAVDARADQFSYCVAAWEAVFGVRPFSVEGLGLDAVPELLEKIERTSPVRPEGTSVPPAISAALQRGLAPDPEARWPDMDALLAALVQARRPTRADRKWPVVAAISAAAIAAGVVAFVIARDRRASEAPPAAVTPPPPAPPAVDAKRLFGVPMRTSMAISADGKRIALGSNRLEVRDLEGDGLWTISLPPAGDVVHLEIEGERVRFSVKTETAIGTWDYLRGTDPTPEAAIDGRWYGRTALGELIYRWREKTLHITSGGRDVASWTVPHQVEVTAISPNGRRLAYLDSERFTGTIIVRDLATGAEVTSDPLQAPTALAWLDDEHLAFATGTLDRPRIAVAPVTAKGFDAATELYSLATGWFGQLRAHGNDLYLTTMNPSTRVRVIERSARQTSAHDLDNATGGAALAWTGDDEFLTWNRDTRRLDRRSSRVVAVTALSLDGEPANATLAGDTLIVTLRRPTGREVLGLSLRDGTRLWRHGDDRTFAVRCAGDRQAPCFAIRTDKDQDALVTLDPRTGELGTTPIRTGSIEDVAVSDDGTRLLLSNSTSNIDEIDAAGTSIATHTTPLSSVRSVAFDPRGGILVGGTRSLNDFEVGRLVGAELEELTRAEDQILSLVRPSRDGSQILVLARVFSPEVWRLRIRK